MSNGTEELEAKYANETPPSTAMGVPDHEWRPEPGLDALEQRYARDEIDKMQHSHETPLQGGVSNIDAPAMAMEAVKGAPTGFFKMADALSAPGNWAADAAVKAFGGEPKHLPTYTERYERAVPPKQKEAYEFGGDALGAFMPTPFGPATGAKGALAFLRHGMVGAAQTDVPEIVKQINDGHLDPTALAISTGTGFGLGGAVGGMAARGASKAARASETAQRDMRAAYDANLASERAMGSEGSGHGMEPQNSWEEQAQAEREHEQAWIKQARDAQMEKLQQAHEAEQRQNLEQFLQQKPTPQLQQVQLKMAQQQQQAQRAQAAKQNLEQLLQQKPTPLFREGKPNVRQNQEGPFIQHQGEPGPGPGQPQQIPGAAETGSPGNATAQAQIQNLLSPEQRLEQLRARRNAVLTKPQTSEFSAVPTEKEIADKVALNPSELKLGRTPHPSEGEPGALKFQQQYQHTDSPVNPGMGIPERSPNEVWRDAAYAKEKQKIQTDYQGRIDALFDGSLSHPEKKADKLANAMNDALAKLEKIYKPSGFSQVQLIPALQHALTGMSKVGKKLGAAVKDLKPEHYLDATGNATISDIIANHADPEFAAAYERRIFGKLSQMRQIPGFKAPTAPQEIDEFGRARFMDPEQIMKLPNLSDPQKMAALHINSVLEEQAEAHRAKIAELASLTGKNGLSSSKKLSNGYLRAALQADLSANLDRKSPDFMKTFGHMLARGAVNGAVVGNPGVYYNHLIEAMATGHTNPISFYRANARLAKGDKLMHEAVDMFAGGGNYKQMQLYSPNPISRKSAEIQQAIWKAIPGTSNETVAKVAKGVQAAITGSAAENAKMKALYGTSILKTAHELGYKDANNFMRKLVDGSMESDEQLMAAIKINRNVNDWIGAMPLGYRDLTMVDRAGELPGVGGLIQFGVPLAKTATMQARAIAKCGIRASNAFKRGDWKQGSREIGNSFMFYGTLALFCGSKAIPTEAYQGMNADTKKAFDDHMNRLALLGNALQNSAEHVQPSVLPWAKAAANGGFYAGTLHDVQTLADGHKSGWQKAAAGVAIAELFGLGNIADTISPERLVTIASRTAQADELGGREEWVYKEAGLKSLMENIGNTIQKKQLDAGFIAHGIRPASRLEVFAQALFNPGTAMPSFEYKKKREQEYDFRQEVTQALGRKAAGEFWKDYNSLAPNHELLYDNHKAVGKGNPDALYRDDPFIRARLAKETDPAKREQMQNKLIKKREYLKMAEAGAFHEDMGNPWIGKDGKPIEGKDPSNFWERLHGKLSQLTPEQLAVVAGEPTK